MYRVALHLFFSPVSGFIVVTDLAFLAKFQVFVLFMWEGQLVPGKLMRKFYSLFSPEKDGFN